MIFMVIMQGYTITKKCSATDNHFHQASFFGKVSQNVLNMNMIKSIPLKVQFYQLTLEYL